MTSKASATLRLTGWRSPRVQQALTVWAVFLLMSGQGFRYLLGLPLYVGFALATVVAVAASFRPSKRSLRPPLLIGAFVGLAALSILWSSTRWVTLLASVVLAATTFVAMVTVRGSTNTRFMELLYRGLQFSLFTGVAFELIVALIFRGPVGPLAGDLSDLAEVDPGDDGTIWSKGDLFTGGPIQGFVGNRNPFGAIALLTGIVALILTLERRISRLDGIGTLVVAGVVHLLTLSATVTAAGVAIAVLLLGAMAIRRASLRGKRILSISLLACIAVTAVLTLKYRDALFAMLDRRSDFTNRTFIWTEVIDYAAERPEGYGFVGYWPVWATPYKEINEATNAQAEYPLIATHAHNAFLDAWLQLGLIGLALLLAIVILMFGSAWRLVERAEKGDTYIPLGWALLAAALALQALTESRMLVESGWYLLVALFCMGPPVFRLTIVDPDLVHTGTRVKMGMIPGRVTVFTGFDHVQIAIPEGGEEQAREFYAGVLGMEEIPKPPELEARGGCWFETGDVVLHLGTEPEFTPARKAHPAIIVENLYALQRALQREGYECVRSDNELPGIRRFHTVDVFGNRIEFQQA